MSDATPMSFDPRDPRAPDPEPRAARSFVTGRPVAVLMLFIAAVVFGYFSYGRLPVALMPELTYPTLTVRTEYEGAAPEEVENDISRPIEEALGVIGGLRRISSISRAEVSDVVLEFAWDVDISDATQDVLERLDLVFLPEEAARPLILHFDPSLDPVLALSLSGLDDRFEGEEGLRRLRRIADRQVKRALEPISGVAAVRVMGGLEEEIHVLLDEGEMRRTGISIGEVLTRLRQENVNVAGGMIQEGRTEYLVRTLNEFEDHRQIEDTIVRRMGDRPVRVRDLGRVEWGHKERQIITRTDGAESVQIEIFKEGDANIVALADRVEEALGTLTIPAGAEERGAEASDAEASNGAMSAPAGGLRGDRGLAQQLYEDEGVRLELTADRSVFIESSIREVRSTAIIGGLLAVLMLFLFLRDVRATTIVAVSIPISLLVTFAPLNLAGVSLNIMSLGGLALGIGMLVDSSIVVLESIHRCREEGDGLVGAAVRGVNEVRGAVWASTLTSIAVFFPMVFVEGVAGQAFGDLGIAVVVSLLASASVALYFIPMLASRGAPGGGLPERRALFRLRAWRALRSEWVRSRRRTKLLVLTPAFWLVRFVVEQVLELLGLLVTMIAVGLGWLLVRGVSPVVRFLFRFLVAGPLWITDRLLGAVTRGYPVLLGWVLRSGAIVLVITAAIVTVSVLMVRSLDSELLPEVRQGEFTLEVSLPVGTPLETTDEVLSRAEDALLDVGANVRTLLLTLGYDPAQSDRSDEGEHTARFRVLVGGGVTDGGSWLSRAVGRLSGRGDARDAGAIEDHVIDRMRDVFARVPDLELNVSRPVLFSSRTPIEVEVHGDDLGALRDQAERVEAALAGLPELADVQSTLQPGAPEIQVVYDRERLMAYDLNVSAVARQVRDGVQGAEATRLNRFDRRIPIMVQLDRSFRETVDDIQALVVNPGADRPVRLSQVADVRVGEGPSEVRRVDGQRVALIRANIGDASLGSAVAAIERMLGRAIEWPPELTYYISGQNEEWERSRGSLVLALGLSVFLVYVIMAVQFESLLHPLVIMLAIPMAFVGTFAGLWLFGIPLSVVAFLGMIMLAGIVVNNAIVLVDYVNQLRRRGLSREEAILAAGRVRLRPILMTTATTVLGLLPMAIGIGDGAEIRTPMAIAVISGLLTSTVLTLVVVPWIYAIVDGLAERLWPSRAGADVDGEGRPVPEVTT